MHLTQLNNKVDCKLTLRELKTRATPPQGEGEDIDVPFINIRGWRVHLGNGATTHPRALKPTLKSPSVVGPLLDLFIEGRIIHELMD